MTVAELAPRCLVTRIWSINLSHFQSFLFCICPWIRQLLHWLYDNHGEEELCIRLLQVNCELKKSIPYALPLKNRYCRFVFTLSLPKFCIGVMSFPMISLGFYIHPNIWHVCEAVLKFIGVYVWLGAVIWLNCWIMEQLQQKLSGFVFFFTNDIVQSYVHFGSWQDRWKVSYSCCHLVTLETISLACSCCLIIFHLFYEGH